MSDSHIKPISKNHLVLSTNGNLHFQNIQINKFAHRSGANGSRKVLKLATSLTCQVFRRERTKKSTAEVPFFKIVCRPRGGLMWVLAIIQNTALKNTTVDLSLLFTKAL